MKNPLILSIVALVLCAVALATSLVNLTASETGGRTAPPEEVLVPDSELLARVETLTEENQALRDRLSALELRPLPTPRAPVTDEFLPREEFDAFRDEVADALASGGALARSTPKETALFKEQVASTLSEIRLEETQAAIQKKLDGRVAELDRTMQRLGSWLELTPHQSEAVRSELLARYERDADLMRRWKAGDDEQVLGEQKRIDHQTHLDELSQILSPQQLETYSSRSGGGKSPGNGGVRGRGK